MCLFLECSTPFGINDSCTLSVAVVPLPWFPSAQRLSASTIPAPGISSSLLAVVFKSAQRLSASTIPAPGPFASVGQRLARRAQRLSASTIPALSSVKSEGRPSRSAQRLSASTIPAPGQSPKTVGTGMCSTPFGINDSCTPPQPGGVSDLYGVLNAFRHQRFLHRRTRSLQS